MPTTALLGPVLSDDAAVFVALEASETRYRRLFQTAKDGILILDAASRQDHRRQPVHERTAGLHPRRVPGQGTLGDRPVRGHRGEPGRLPRAAARRATSATSTCRCETQSGPRGRGRVRQQRLPRWATATVIQCNIRDITRAQPAGAAAPGAGGGAGRPAPPQGRVPGDALARAPQPAVADPQRRAAAAACSAARRPRSSSRRGRSSSARWGNCHGSSTTCWRSPASPAARCGSAGRDAWTCAASCERRWRRPAR